MTGADVLGMGGSFLTGAQDVANRAMAPKGLDVPRIPILTPHGHVSPEG